MWSALGPSGLPFFVPLTTAQREMVTRYHNQALQDAHEFRDPIRSHLLPASTSIILEREDEPLPRDLDAEMRAMGLGK
ncbi:unnamed protein product [Phytomonas sp. Hart1]|nr:unnamed protein product [Phytomonas sp. Hart1]|eukprot:CCW70592.1 unnamed protein product [Phytomonas sp. isolate Hart1]